MVRLAGIHGYGGFTTRSGDEWVTGLDQFTQYLTDDGLFRIRDRRRVSTASATDGDESFAKALLQAFGSYADMPIDLRTSTLACLADVYAREAQRLLQTADKTVSAISEVVK